MYTIFIRRGAQRTRRHRGNKLQVRLLGEHPLVAYTIFAAKKAEIFSDIILSSDNETYAAIARYYGANVPFLRPPEFATSTSPDIEWVSYTLRRLAKEENQFDCVSILRPTSPFRTSETIRRAWKQFLRNTLFDSLRAVEKCSQHPGKMGVLTPAKAEIHCFGGSADPGIPQS